MADITDHPDYPGIIRAVCEDPEDDLPRMAAADFFEEHTDLDPALMRIARLIRSQLELARTLGDGPLPDDPLSFGSLRLGSNMIRLALWNANWIDPQPLHGKRRRVACLWRGFVRSVCLDSECFVNHAADLFSHQPVTDVVLRDLDPVRIDNGFVWIHEKIPDRESSIPEVVWTYYKDFLPKNPCRAEDAMEALSRACVRYGRMKVGLPELRK